MLRSLLLAAVVFVCLAFPARPASAQSFSFGISSGRYGHHHHHGGWGFDYHDCWHDHYYYPRYVYAYPPPSYYYPPYPYYPPYAYYYPRPYPRYYYPAPYWGPRFTFFFGGGGGNGYHHYHH